MNLGENTDFKLIVSFTGREIIIVLELRKKFNFAVMLCD